MRKRFAILMVSFLVVSAFFCGIASADNKEDVTALVKKGADYIQKNGIEKAVDAFQTPEFKKGDLFLFVYDYTGKCVVNGAVPQLVGKNMINLMTPSGKYLIKEQIEIAKKGGGWLSYEWMHQDKKVVTPKESYIMPIEGKDMFVACGFYKEQ